MKVTAYICTFDGIPTSGGEYHIPSVEFDRKDAMEMFRKAKADLKFAALVNEAYAESEVRLVRLIPVEVVKKFRLTRKRK